jgi:hypothetical protein
LVKVPDLFRYPKYWAHLRASLITMNRTDLIGDGPEHLISADDTKAYKYKNGQFNKVRGGRWDNRKGSQKLTKN